MENVKNTSVLQGELRSGSSCLQCTCVTGLNAFGPHRVVMLTKRRAAGWS